MTKATTHKTADGVPIEEALKADTLWVVRWRSGDIPELLLFRPLCLAHLRATQGPAAGNTYKPDQVFVSLAPALEELASRAMIVAAKIRPLPTGEAACDMIQV